MFWLNINDLTKSYGETVILKDVSFDIFNGEHVGLVGPNGAGKTTLFKLLTGKEGFDKGEIAKPSEAIFGVLDQIPSYPEEYTVLDVLKTAFSRFYEIENRMNELFKSLDSAKNLDEYGRLETEFSMGGYTINSDIAKICNGLKIPADMQSRRFSLLSGGEKTRVNLGRIMLLNTDVLLLDEPTNHLDINSVEWLEDFLNQYKGTVLIISHDRYFLDKVTVKTVELENLTSTTYSGNYSFYIKQKEQNYATLLAQYERTQKEAKRLSDVARVMHERGTEKLHITAFAIERRVERMMSGVTKPAPKRRSMKAKFGERETASNEVINIKNVEKSYNSIKLCDNLSLTVRKEDRVALIGDNGCGKSTLLNIITKKLLPDNGYVKFGDSVKYAFLEQEIRFTNPDTTVLDVVMTQLRLTNQSARDRLGMFMFSGDDVYKTLRSLSGGEKNRLHLCLIMKNEVNLLLLDEPTNHLDIMSREWLEDSINDFDGTLLFVSHDRYFINKFATRIWEMANGQIIDFYGTYDEYKQEKKRISDLSDLNNDKIKEKAGKSLVKADKTQKPRSEKSILKMHESYEKKIAECEYRLANIDEEINDASSDYMRLMSLLNSRGEIEKELDALFTEWEKQDTL